MEDGRLGEGKDAGDYGKERQKAESETGSEIEGEREGGEAERGRDEEIKRKRDEEMERSREDEMKRGREEERARKRGREMKR